MIRWRKRQTERGQRESDPTKSARSKAAAEAQNVKRRAAVFFFARAARAAFAARRSRRRSAGSGALQLPLPGRSMRLFEFSIVRGRQVRRFSGLAETANACDDDDWGADALLLLFLVFAPALPRPSSSAGCPSLLNNSLLSTLPPPCRGSDRLRQVKKEAERKQPWTLIDVCIDLARQVCLEHESWRASKVTR